RTRGVRGGRSCGVTCRRAEHHAGAVFECFRDRDDHPPVLERARRILTLDLEPDLRNAGLALEYTSAHQRSASLAEGKPRCPLGDRKIRGVAIDEAARVWHGEAWYSVSTIRLGISRCANASSSRRLSCRSSSSQAS